MFVRPGSHESANIVFMTSEWRSPIIGNVHVFNPFDSEETKSGSKLSLITGLHCSVK